MADDIVTRLREHEKHWSQGHEGKTDCERGLCSQCEAADEIEHLREWKELAYEMRNKYWWFMRAKTLRRFDAMHRADWQRHDPLGDSRG